GAGSGSATNKAYLPLRFRRCSASRTPLGPVADWPYYSVVKNSASALVSAASALSAVKGFGGRGSGPVTDWPYVLYPLGCDECHFQAVATMGSMLAYSTCQLSSVLALLESA